MAVICKSAQPGRTIILAVDIISRSGGTPTEKIEALEGAGSAGSPGDVAGKMKRMI